MCLSRAQKTEANSLGKRYAEIFTEWSRNPANFEQTIQCLKNLRDLNDDMCSMYVPLAESGANRMSHGGLFNKAAGYHQLTKGLNTGKRIMRLMMNDDTTTAIKAAFAKEHRITSLSAQREKSGKTTTRGGVTLSSETNKGNYTITFSDGITITLHSLEDAETLKNAKVIFEDKLNELDPKNARAAFRV